MENSILQNHAMKFIGIGGNPLVRSEFGAILPNFEIICTKEVESEIQAIGKDMLIKVFPIKTKTGKQAKRPGVILEDEGVQEYIESFKQKFEKIAIITFKPSKEVQDMCDKYDWVYIGNDYKIAKMAANKKVFQEILEEQKIQTTATLTTLQNLEKNQDKFLEKYDNHMVVQMTEKSDGGHGTFFCNIGEDCLEKIKERMQTWRDDLGDDPSITIDFFTKGDEISVSGCITRQEVFVSEPQQQLIDIPELVWGKSDGTGIFCGHDWVIKIPSEIQENVILITKKVGEGLKERGVRGFYGVDFIVDTATRRVVSLEANIRLTGVYPTFMDVQILNSEVPLGLLHIMEFLDMHIEEISLVQNKDSSQRVGAQMLLFNPVAHNIQITQTLRAGIYSYPQMEYVRPGYRLSELQGDEFLIVDGVPREGDVYNKNRKLCKIISRKQLLKEGHTLTEYAKNVSKKVYDKILFQRVSRK